MVTVKGQGAVKARLSVENGVVFGWFATFLFCPL